MSRLTQHGNRTAIIRLSALLIIVLSVLLCAAPSGRTAVATEGKAVDAVTNITIDNQTIHEYDVVKVNIDWSAPAGTKAGDWFSIGLPNQFITITHDDISLYAPDGSTVANCSVNDETVRCVFTGYVDQHGAVSGNMYLSVRAKDDGGNGPGNWDINGNASNDFPVPPVVPPAPSPAPAPDYFAKSGWATNDNGIDLVEWEVIVGAQRFLVNGEPAKITDTPDSKLDLYPNDDSFVPSVRYAVNDQWGKGIWTNMTEDVDFTSTVDSAKHQFTIDFKTDSTNVKKAIADAKNDDLTMQIYYDTRPYTAPQKGETYTNHAEGTGGKPADVQYEWDNAGGNGQGEDATVRLVKCDEASITCDEQSGTKLPDAVFDLMSQHDGKGHAIKTGLTTDPNGLLEVDGLTKGDYSFVETKAPKGYAKAAPLDFTIDDSIFPHPSADASRADTAESDPDEPVIHLSLKDSPETPTPPVNPVNPVNPTHHNHQ